MIEYISSDGLDKIPDLGGDSYISVLTKTGIPMRASVCNKRYTVPYSPIRTTSIEGEKGDMQEKANISFD